MIISLMAWSIVQPQKSRMGIAEGKEVVWLRLWRKLTSKLDLPALLIASPFPIVLLAPIPYPLRVDLVRSARCC